MRTFEFEVMGQPLIGQTASASDQHQLLRLITQGGALCLLDDEWEDESGTKRKATLLDRFMAVTILPDHIYNQVVKIVTGASAGKDLIKRDDGVPVSESMFSENIHRFVLIIAEAVKGNLQSFTELTALDERASKSEENL